MNENPFTNNNPVINNAKGAFNEQNLKVRDIYINFDKTEG